MFFVFVWWEELKRTAENVRHLLDDKHLTLLSVTLWSVCGPLLATDCSVLCFSYSELYGLFEYALCLWWGKVWSYVGVVRCLESASNRRPLPAMRSPTNSCSRRFLCAQCAVQFYSYCYSNSACAGGLSRNSRLLQFKPGWRITRSFISRLRWETAAHRLHLPSLWKINIYIE
jgi:hypothetical protein